MWYIRQVKDIKPYISYYNVKIFKKQQKNRNRQECRTIQTIVPHDTMKPDPVWQGRQKGLPLNTEDEIGRAHV